MRNTIESFHEVVPPILSSSLTLKKDLQEGSKDGSNDSSYESSISESKDSGKVSNNELEQDVARSGQSAILNQYKAPINTVGQLKLSSSIFDGNVSNIIDQPPLIKETDLSLSERDDSPLRLPTVPVKEEKYLCGPKAGIVTIINACENTLTAENCSILNSTPKQQPVGQEQDDSKVLFSADTDQSCDLEEKQKESKRDTVSKVQMLASSLESLQFGTDSQVPRHQNPIYESGRLKDEKNKLARRQSRK